MVALVPSMVLLQTFLVNPTPVKAKQIDEFRKVPCMDSISCSSPPVGKSLAPTDPRRL